jgi:hypothetical protein
MLWVNGQNLLLVNASAADFIEAFIEVMSRHRDKLETDSFKLEIASFMQQKYPRVPVEVLIRDFDNIYGSILEVSQGS